MRDKVQMGIGMLAGALLLGLIGDGLLRVGPWSANLFLWICALIVVLVGLALWQGVPWEGAGGWLLIPILVLGTAIVWRDSVTLKVVNTLAILLALAFVMLRGRAGQLLIMGIVEFLVSLAVAGLNMAFGFLLLVFGDIPWKNIPHERSLRPLGAIVRGILLALPFLLIFGGLFAAADARFEHLLARMFRFNAEDFVEHAFVVGVCAWLAGGFLRGTLMRDETKLISISRPGFMTLGCVEMGVALGLLNLLFLSFVCVQIPYFFGGQAHVIATAGLTAADYARRGFFELVTVAALVLPLLLTVQGLLSEDNKAAQRFFSVLAGTITALTFVIMASAMQRMWLYHIGFGLTELRFYTTAFMGWLGIVFIWFTRTALRGQRRRFVFGALALGLVMLVWLNICNPDDFIVRANVARLAHGRIFDGAYAASLSADAVPALISAWPQLNEENRHTVATTLMARWGAQQREDWRIWNVGRNGAHMKVRRHASEMRDWVEEVQVRPASPVESRE